MEIYWIKFYRSNNPNYGYNGTEGGYGVRGYKYTKEQLLRMSQAHKGKKLTQEHKMKISIGCTGKITPELCVPIKCVETGIVYHSIWDAMKKHKLNRGNLCLSLRGMRDSCNGLHWEYLDDKKRQKSKEKRRFIINNHRLWTKVKCIETDVIYKSIADAAIELNKVKPSKSYCHNISAVCMRKRKSCGGFHWEYIQNENNTILPKLV